MRVTQTLLLTAVALLIFGTCDDTELRKKYLVARVYNEQTMTSELAYLNTIDINKLSDEQKAAVAARREELEKAQNLLSTDPNIVINLARCLPEVRVPPLPCPRSEDGAVAFPIGTEIELDLIGVFMDQTTSPQARVLVDQGTAQMATDDGKIFAQGSLNAFDSLFQTAWYQFEVKNPALASGSLVLKITTQVIINQQIEPVSIEKIIPAGTFLGHNIY